MCECLKLLLQLGYVQKNLLNESQYLIYPVVDKKLGKTPVSIYFCPSCGKKIDEVSCSSR